MILAKLRLAVQVRIAKLIKSGIQQLMLFEFVGSVLDLWKALDGAAKFMAIDKQANHRVMHQNRFGEANGFTSQALDPCS